MAETMSHQHVGRGLAWCRARGVARGCTGARARGRRVRAAPSAATGRPPPLPTLAPKPLVSATQACTQRRGTRHPTKHAPARLAAGRPAQDGANASATGTITYIPELARHDNVPDLPRCMTATRLHGSPYGQCYPQVSRSLSLRSCRRGSLGLRGSFSSSTRLAPSD